MALRVLTFKFTRVVLLVLFLAGCNSPEQKLLNEAQLEVERGHFRIAITHLDKILIRSPNTEYSSKAAREAARLAFYEIQDFEKAAKYYQMLVIDSPNPEERLAAQRQIVSVYFDHLTNYPRAVIEINKLIAMLENQKEKTDFKMKLARAYYYQNNFSQAENEANEFLRGHPPVDQKFDMIFLIGNINLAKKDVTKAIETFKKLLSEYPERAAKDNVGLTLSVCYEEQKDFKSAIDLLEKVRATHPTPEYIDIRIKRLQERLRNQPGAHGKIRK